MHRRRRQQKKRLSKHAVAARTQMDIVVVMVVAMEAAIADDNLFAMYKKIYRGDFKCPRWFSGDARRLITKLLNPDPNSRIIISKIMESPWFKKPVPKNMLRGMKEEDEEEKEKEIEEKMKQPSTMSAFLIISLSEGFDLLRLFEEKKREGREGGDEVCDGGNGEQRDISTGGGGKRDEVRCKEEQQ
ncbi:CBL-interacting serine/threonine-protein kinase 6-like [Arachis duranensis]|uniref:non-specific serine/threonine protein kinase n=1 Tax=Arachis duranensis TaxID=130453 RepID=A0A9C6WG18_ARADU|nr:CBL-interacting serine/threonine-protein kinase 6-like [Arachis duranensis]